MKDILIDKIYCNLHLSVDDSFELYPKPFTRLEVDTVHPQKDQLIKMGFRFVDRTIGVKVLLKKCPDLSRSIRFPITELEGSRGGIAQVAQEGLSTDFRFNITDDVYVKNAIIEKYIEECQKMFVISKEGIILGFIGLVENGDKVPFIHLAAVKPEYQATGISVALYSWVMMRYKEEGRKSIYGRISSSNMPVMNLYSSFGCKFFDPCDIYIR